MHTSVNGKFDVEVISIHIKIVKSLDLKTLTGEKSEETLIADT